MAVNLEKERVLKGLDLVGEDGSKHRPWETLPHLPGVGEAIFAFDIVRAAIHSAQILRKDSLRIPGWIQLQGVLHPEKAVASMVNVIGRHEDPTYNLIKIAIHSRQLDFYLDRAAVDGAETTTSALATAEATSLAGAFAPIVGPLGIATTLFFGDRFIKDSVTAMERGDAMEDEAVRIGPNWRAHIEELIKDAAEQAYLNEYYTGLLREQTMQEISRRYDAFFATFLADRIKGEDLGEATAEEVLDLAQSLDQTESEFGGRLKNAIRAAVELSELDDLHLRRDVRKARKAKLLGEIVTYDPGSGRPGEGRYRTVREVRLGQ